LGIRFVLRSHPTAAQIKNSLNDAEAVAARTLGSMLERINATISAARVAVAVAAAVGKVGGERGATAVMVRNNLVVRSPLLHLSKEKCFFGIYNLSVGTMKGGD